MSPTHLHYFGDLGGGHALLLHRDGRDEELVPDQRRRRRRLRRNLHHVGRPRAQAVHRRPHLVLVRRRRLDLVHRGTLARVGDGQPRAVIEV